MMQPTCAPHKVIIIIISIIIIIIGSSWSAAALSQASTLTLAKIIHRL